MEPPMRVQSYKELLKDKAKIEQELNESLGKSITKDEKPYRDKHVLTIIKSTWKSRSCQPFWQKLVHIHHLDSNPVMIWKALGLVHRLLHDGYPTVLQEFYQHRDYVQDLGAKASKSLHSYSKITGLAAQFVVLKLEFHHKHPSFAGNLQDEVHFPDYRPEDLQVLLDAFLEEQQMILMLCMMAFSLMKTIAQEHSIECVAAPLVTYVAEAAAIYDKLTDILYVLHESKPPESLDSRRRRFDDQHHKLRSLFEEFRTHTQLRIMLEVPHIPEAPPSFLHPKPASKPTRPARVSFDQTGMQDEWNAAQISSLQQQIEDLKKEAFKAQTLLTFHETALDQYRKAVLESDPHAVQQIEASSQKTLPSSVTPNALYASLAQKNIVLEGILTDIKIKGGQDHESMLEGLAAAQRQVDELEHHVASFTIDKDVSFRTIASLRAVNQDNAKEIDALKARLAQTEAVNSELRAKMASLNAINTEYQGKILDLNNQVAEGVSRAEALTEQTAVLENTYNGLLEELERSLKDTQEKLAASMGEQATLQGEVSSLRASLGQRTADIARAQEAQTLLEEKLQQSQEKVLGHMKVEGEQQQAISSLHALRDDHVAQIAALKAQLAEGKTKAEAMESRGKDQAAQLQARIDALQAELMQSQSLLLTKAQEGQTANEAFNTLQRQLSTSQQELASLKAANNTLSDDLKEAKLRAADQEHTVASLRATLESETSQLKEANKTLSKQLSECQGSVTQAKLEMEQATQANEKNSNALRRDLEAAQSALSEKTKLSAEQATLVDALQGKLKALQAERDNQSVDASVRADAFRKQIEEMLSQAERQRTEALSKVQGEVRSNERQMVLAALKGALNTLSEISESSLQNLPQISISPDVVGEMLSSVKSKMASLSDSYTSYNSTGMLNAGVISSPSSMSDALRAAWEGLVQLTMAEQTRKEEAVKLVLAGKEHVSARLGALIASLSEGKGVLDMKDLMAALESSVSQMSTLCDTVASESSSKTKTLDQEMLDAGRTIDEQTARVQGLIENARKEMNESQLAVSEGLLTASMTLMRLIQALLKATAEVQKEIVEKEAGNATKDKSQFYKRNHRWVEGLISAAKEVGAGATVLVDSADLVVKGEGKFEEVMVAGHQIAASTVQLVTATRVKAAKDSEKKKSLEAVSKQVSDATKALIEAARGAGKASQKTQKARDFLSLSITQARRLEMDTQIRVLELETELGREREKLGELRRMQYQTDDSNA